MDILELIVYDSIEKKNLLEAKAQKVLTSQESLAHCLDLMDFLAAFNKNKLRPADEVDWILLEMESYDFK